jgi:S1-C subfamily serine protease
MEKMRWLLKIVMLGCLSQGCSVSPPAPQTVAPNRATSQIIAERVGAVIVTKRENIDDWVRSHFVSDSAVDDADGGSAAPISGDGYFLTADHVLAKMMGRNVFVLYQSGGQMTPAMARVIWRSKKDDLALLHIPVQTPYFYQWSPPDKWLPAGTFIRHGGVSTGSKALDGKLATTIPPQGRFTSSRPFKMDIPLQPGDSGGPVVDAYGRLIGINSAVEFLVPIDTAFFISSEGNRPNIQALEKLIQADRRQHPMFPQKREIQL